MSLKESWQQQRQQRQQEVMLRQQMVQQELESVRQERQSKAAQLRADLSLFRDTIAVADQTRRTEFQPLKLELQQFYGQLQIEVQKLLSAASDRRQAEAKEVAQQLEAFVQQIQQEVAQLLSEMTAERSLMAQQLEKDLAAFVTALRLDVRSYLGEVEALRQQRAEQLQQELAQSRAKREAEARALFQHLAEFRFDLRNEVWGDGSAMPAKPIAVKGTSVKTFAKNGLKSANKSSLPSIAVSVNSLPSHSRAVIPVASSKPAATEDIAHEKAVYNFIHTASGARLTQIESALNINRFQAVDALRVLIKKGLITQRDRVYLTQEQLAQR